MNGRSLEAVESAKGVGVLLHKSFRPSLHCAIAAKKANMVLGQLSSGVSFRDRMKLIWLYKTFMRDLEYCVHTWASWTLGDKKVLESVQRGAVVIVSNLRGSTYE